MESVPVPEENSEQKRSESAVRFEPRVGTIPAPDAAALRAAMQRLAQDIGILRIGFTSAEPFLEAGQRFKEWLARGSSGAMKYLAEQPERHLPSRLLANARSIVVAATALPSPTAPRHDAHPADSDAIRGAVAGYALGLDYHVVLRSRLGRLGQGLADLSGRAVWTRACVDTAPLLEREAARRAGIGFIAKSTMLIVPGVGPRVLLAALITDLELQPDEPMATRCGRCTACLDACPTGAFDGPYQLDARRCLSYLNIEQVGPFPEQQRSKMQQRVVGCDVCQSVCPYDHSDRATVMPTESAPRSALLDPDLVHWLEMTSSEYRRITKGTAVRRLHRAQLMRNAAIALGNSQSVRAVAPLVRALRTNKSALVREHVAWALGELGGADAEQALRDARIHDPDDSVRREIEVALSRLTR